MLVHQRDLIVLFKGEISLLVLKIQFFEKAKKINREKKLKRHAEHAGHGTASLTCLTWAHHDMIIY